MKKALSFFLVIVLLLSFIPAALAAPEDLTEQDETPVYTVSFDLNGGEGEAPGPVLTAEGGGFELDGVASFSRDGYLCRGWSRDIDAVLPEISIYGTGPDGGVPIYEDTVFYAVWQLIVSHKVSFDLGGGVVTVESVTTGRTPESVPAVTDETRTFIGWIDESGAPASPEETVIYGDVTFSAVYAPLLNTWEHIKYMSGYSDGTFRPGNRLSRAEAAQILYTLLAEKPEVFSEFSDVASDSWCYEAVGALAGLGIITGYNGEFRPSDYITRAEFVAILSRFFPAGDVSGRVFTDVPANHWAVNAIYSAEYKGWVGGYEDGTFRPDNTITRAEAVRVLNKVLGRAADREAVDGLGVLVFVDIGVSHWAYYDIMEAVVAHKHEYGESGGEKWIESDDAGITLPAGMLYIDGELYYIVGQSGRPVANTNINGFEFGYDGKYTSGSEELDGYVKAALAEVTNSSMTRLEMLRAAYNYTRDSFTYLRRNYYSVGDTGWEMQEGLIMFQTKLGNCYCYTAAFYYLARQLGFECTAISGLVGSNRSPHGWVEITFDGVVYIFDTELEMAQREKGRIYDFFMMPYSKTPWPYLKAKG